MATRYSLSESLSIVSQPGMQALSTCGSLSPSHTFCCGTGMICSPVISIVVPFVRMRRKSGADASGCARWHAGEEAFELLLRDAPVAINVHRVEHRQQEQVALDVVPRDVTLAARV